MLHTTYQETMPSGFRQEYFYVLYMKVNVKMLVWPRKCNTNTLQANPWHREEESKSNNSLINSLTFRMMPVWPQNHHLNKFGIVLLGDATYQISGLLVSDKDMFSAFSISRLGMSATTQGGSGRQFVTGLWRLLTCTGRQVTGFRWQI